MSLEISEIRERNVKNKLSLPPQQIRQSQSASGKVL